MKINTNTIKKAVISILAVYVCLIFTIIFSNVFHKNMFSDFLNYSLPVLIGLVLFPMTMVRANIIGITSKPRITFGVAEILLLCISAIVIIIKSYTGFNYIFSIIIIAFAEEILFRYFLIDIDNYSSLIISSIIFAFVVHMNEPLITNLVIRLPLGLALGFIYITKKTLLWCIVLHFIYNLMMS